jgi:hypothetical protein
MESSFESRVRARLTRIGGALVAAGKRENGRDRNNLRPCGWSDGNLLSAPPKPHSEMKLGQLSRLYSRPAGSGTSH